MRPRACRFHRVRARLVPVSPYCTSRIADASLTPHIPINLHNPSSWVPPSRPQTRTRTRKTVAQARQPRPRRAYHPQLSPTVVPMHNQHYIHIANPSTMSSSSPATTAISAPTTTYPFTYTTYTNASPQPFTKPTIIPSLFSFGSALSCTANTPSTSVPSPTSSAPLDPPLGLTAACVISNAAETNEHAFWDLYACCDGGDMTAFGSPFPCTAQCSVGEGKKWQDVGECLSKRVGVVVCKPRFEEIGNATASSSGGGSASASASASSSGGARTSGSGSGASASSSSSVATGAASKGGVVHTTTSKAGLVLFGLLAVGSAVGMLL